MIVAMLAATVLMADSTTALQSTAAAPASAASQPAKNKAGNQADLICKSEPVLGSRLPVKKCRTAEQAAADKQNAREELERTQDARTNNPR